MLYYKKLYIRIYGIPREQFNGKEWSKNLNALVQAQWKQDRKKGGRGKQGGLLHSEVNCVKTAN